MAAERVVRALRGANGVARDTPEAIHGATVELLTAMMERNALVADDLISVIFTMTPDLVSEFPAVAAREMGLVSVPLLCAAEIPVPGALASCVRVLMHVNCPADRTLQPVYLGAARALRADLADPPA